MADPTGAGAASEISADEAIGMVADGSWLLDVREPAEWEGGHAEGAHLIPMSVIERRAPEIPTDQHILVICHSGYRSWQVTKALVAAGYDAVSVAGGIEAWQSAGGVVVRDGSDPLEA